MRSRVRLMCLILAGLISLAAAVGFASLPGDIIKVGGIALIVDKFGGQINTFINKLTLNKNAGTTEATKVVPILSLGSGGYVGAVQVAGSKANVERCKAVVQIEGNAVFGRNIRARVLVPVEARSVSNIKRVPGVGVSAIIDIRI